MRLLPRFSLRFAWIALTIFLIVFGVSVNYYQCYQTHERISKKFQVLHCNVEEVPISLFGYTIGKRLTGIEITPKCGDDGSWNAEELRNLEVLEQLPYPHEVRRFGISGRCLEEADNRIFAALERFSNIETVYLHHLRFTAAHAQRLSRLPNLRMLVFQDCTLPDEELPSLEQLPNLEKITLLITDCKIDAFLQLKLPHLQLFESSDCGLEHLDLTKHGWGRFPYLETLILNNIYVKKITFEPGAMPRLKHLAIYGEVDFEGEEAWPNLPAALPELTTFAMPWWGLKPELLPTLSMFPKLKAVYLDLHTQKVGSTTVMPLAQFSPAQIASHFPPDSLPLVKGLLKQRPDLLFDTDSSVLREKLNPTWSRDFHKNEEFPSMWASPHWRKQPKFIFGQAIFDN